MKSIYYYIKITIKKNKIKKQKKIKNLKNQLSL